MFTYNPELFEDGSKSEHWYRDRYKITLYKAHETEESIHKAHFKAYYKPMGGKNWVMGCEKNNPSYKTLREAMQACDRHEKIRRLHIQRIT